MVRVKKPKIEDSSVEESQVEIVVPVEVKPVIENPNVKVIELNGRKVLQVFDPLEGTTHNEPIVE